MESGFPAQLRVDGSVNVDGVLREDVAHCGAFGGSEFSGERVPVGC
jgi:hypothetical protein